MPSRRDIKNAASLFEAFHLKSEGEPVYPFHKEDGGHFEVEVRLPSVEPVGEACRVMYRSDKWEDPGSTHDYYHDHKKGCVRFWLPSGGSGESFPHKWPATVTHLGECMKWYYLPAGEDGDSVVEGVPSSCILVASPKGYVDKLDPSRVFLAILNRKTGQVEGLIEGKTLRLTRRGIEG